jgi:hypothetical protein
MVAHVCNSRAREANIKSLMENNTTKKQQQKSSIDTHTHKTKDKTRKEQKVNYFWGVNLIMIYCKKFYKCHNVSPVQQ